MTASLLARACSLAPALVALVLAQEPGPASVGAPVGLTLVLVDAEGAPVGDATVDVWTDAAAAGAIELQHAWPGLPTAGAPGVNPRDGEVEPVASHTVGGDGIVRVLLPSRDAVFVARSERSGTSGVWYAEKLGGQGSTPLTVPLKPLARVTGTVLLADGSPARDVHVTFREELMGHGQHMFMRSGPSGIARLPPSVRSDEHGAFTSISDGGVIAHAIAIAEDGTCSSTEFAFGSRDGTETCELRFPGRFKIRGVALTPERERIPGVELWFSRRLSTEIRATTDEAGRFEADVFRPGTFQLAVDVEVGVVWIPDAPLRVKLTEASPEADIEVAFIRAVFLRGRVLPTSETGRYASVSARPEPTPDRPLTSWQSVLLGARGRITNAGTFAIPVHPAWSQRVECTVDLSRGLVAVREGVVPGEEELVFEFTARHFEGGRVTGKVVDADTGEVIVDASVALRRMLDTENTLVMDDQSGHATDRAGGGRYEFAGVTLDHQHALEVSAPGYAGQVLGPIDVTDADDERTVALVRAATLRIELPPASATAGELAGDAEPTASASRHLLLLHHDTTPMATKHFFQLLQAIPVEGDEPIVLEGLTPGPVALQFLDGATASPVVVTELTPGGTTTAHPDPSLDTGTGTLLVRAKDAFDRPLAGVRISASWWTGPRGSASDTREVVRRDGRAGPDGILEFESLPEGIWTVAFDDTDVAIAPGHNALVRPEAQTEIVVRSMD